MRLDEVKKGQIWLLDAPKRIARIEAKTQIEVQTAVTVQGKTMPQMAVESAFQAIVTIPHMPIEGYIDDEEALNMAYLRQSLTDVPEMLPKGELTVCRFGTVWHEVWAQRVVHPLVNPPRSMAFVDEEKLELQVYCHAQYGVSRTMERSSPARGMVITGVLLDKGIVPNGMFNAAEKKRPAKNACAGCGQPSAEGVLCAICRQKLNRSNPNVVVEEAPTSGQ